MNARQKLHQVHLQEWTVRFADQKASGLTVRQWCEQNNLSFHTYNYWKHLLKEEVVDQVLPDIVPTPSRPPILRHARGRRPIVGLRCCGLNVQVVCRPRPPLQAVDLKAHVRAEVAKRVGCHRAVRAAVARP